MVNPRSFARSLCRASLYLRQHPAQAVSAVDVPSARRRAVQQARAQPSGRLSDYLGAGGLENIHERRLKLSVPVGGIAQSQNVCGSGIARKVSQSR